MVTIVDDLESLSLQEPIFKDVKYYLSGDVSEKVMVLLQSGGAENTKYFSDYVTHLICGKNAADTDLEEAQEIYQIPAVTEGWVAACVRLKKLASTKAYAPNKNKIFSHVVACVCKVSAADAKALFALVTYHGGKVKLNLDTRCTHLICGSASGKKYNSALTLPAGKLKIVTPDWVLESLRARIQVVAEIFHPKLLIKPQPPLKMDRISSITGFDFEEGIAKNEVPTQNLADNKDDSTQALLDKLKQRMPWNHPPSSANTVTTSAISSMSFTSTPMATSSVMSKNLPQGMVTQNIQIQSSQASSPLMQKFGQNTIVSQSGMTMQGQQVNLQQQTYSQAQQQQQQTQQQQPHGLSAIQIQQQKLLQQHQLRMQMLQQQNKLSNQQNQQFSQPNTSVSQINQNIQGQIQQHMQSSQHHMQQNQNINQTPTTMSSAQQQIENISQMLSQSANNLQQQQLNQQNLAMKQSLSQQSASQAVQNIAQQLAQSSQNFKANLNQNLGQTQVINQQLLSSGQQQLSQQKSQGLMQQQTVQSLTNQQQNINMNVVNQQGLVTSQAQSGQQVQLNQLVGNSGQQNIIGQQIQSVQQSMQGQQSGNVPVQQTWRQQNIQMVQNVQGQHQIIRAPLQSRAPQSQVILQQQIMQTQQQALISNQQSQLSPQHTIQQPQQILQQSINAQGQSISQTHHQILVQKQQLLNNSGQQQIVQAPQQVLINQHTGQQQILVHGNQQVTLQGGQQLVSQSQIVHQGGQIVNQGQQIITQGTQQVLSQGGQHVITQQAQQHQVVIAQSSQQLVAQSGQQIIGQNVGQSQQVLSQVPQSPQPSQLSGGGIQQIITHGGGQQIVSQGGQQIVQGGQGVSWQQQQYLQQRQQIAQPGSVGQRVSWSAGAGGRQLIHLDAQTHAQLQQMDPQQRAMFVAQLQKRRQLSIQRAALAQQQAGGAGGAGAGAAQVGAGAQSVTFIRSQLPPTLTHHQQVQWLQQQGARATPMPPASPAQPPQSPVGGAPVASPVGAGSGGGSGAVDAQLQQLQLQRQQQFQRLQQLQAQRDHAAQHHLPPQGKPVSAQLQQLQLQRQQRLQQLQAQRDHAAQHHLPPQGKPVSAQLQQLQLQRQQQFQRLQQLQAQRDHAAQHHLPPQGKPVSAQLQQLQLQRQQQFQRLQQLQAQRDHAAQHHLPPQGKPVSAQLQQLQLQRQQQFQRLQQLQTQRDHAAQHHLPPQGKPVSTQLQQLQLQRQQQFQRLQQLQLQRQQQFQRFHRGAAGVTQHVAGTSPLPEQQVDAAMLPATPDQQQGAGNALLVNPKTKTALANMLSIRLQGAAPPAEHEPSAAGTLRLMTAAHAAGGAARAPTRLLLGPAHHPHQQPAGVGVGVGGVGGVGGASKVYGGAVRAPPPRAQFYGHNPNLKLPPDLFLLGCVFHIVEYQQSWGPERVGRWVEAIQRRGGEVEPNYCARVTHVLCETQKHGVVMQALRDAKRCVTAYWLSDAMLRRGVAPPWQALHLPAMYAARDRPAKHHRAALSGWRGEERVRLVCCLHHAGAKITPYMTRDNTVLICKRAEGNKYRRARDWAIPTVTPAWVTDLLLGNMSALSQIENTKYQQFNMPSPFRMDYSLVSHLMNAWKMPINITQESHERAKRSAASASANASRRKRPRLEPEPAPPPPAAAPQPPPLHLAPRVLLSAVPAPERARLAAIVRQLGGLIVTSAAEATHLVMEKLVRTCKLVSCLVTVKHLLSTEWVLESQRQNKFADEAQYGLRDDAFNKMFNCDVSEVLLCGEQRKKLFEGVTFFLTPCVKPSKSSLTEMIELCGGKVEKNRRSYVSIQEMHTQRPYSYIVLTVPNDLHLVYYLLQSEKTLNVVCNTEVVMSAIMRQKLEVQEFLVKID